MTTINYINSLQKQQITMPYSCDNLTLSGAVYYQMMLISHAAEACCRTELKSLVVCMVLAGVQLCLLSYAFPGRRLCGGFMVFFLFVWFFCGFLPLTPLLKMYFRFCFLTLGKSKHSRQQYHQSIPCRSINFK